MKIKRFYDNYRKKEINPKNITSMACSNRDGVIDIVFYTDKHIKIPNPIHGYEKNSTNDFILEVAEWFYIYLQV